VVRKLSAVLLFFALAVWIRPVWVSAATNPVIRYGEYVSQSPTGAIRLASRVSATVSVTFRNIAQVSWSNDPANPNYVELRSVNSAGTATQASPLAWNWPGGSTIIIGGPPGVVFCPNGETNPANSVTLLWTAPGDDADIGTAARYDIRLATTALSAVNFGSGTAFGSPPTPSPAGSTDSCTVTYLAPETAYWFALKAADEVPNWSGISNVVSKTTAGTTTTFTFGIRAPVTPGRYTLYFALYHPGTAKFISTTGPTVDVDVVRPTRFDFDGDGVADVWDRTSDGTFHLDYASGGLNGWDFTGLGYGGSLDTPSAADFDGDGKWDFAVLRDSDRRWCIDYASNGFGAWDESHGGYGGSVDYPCPADYDGDGKADISVRDADGDWHLDYASNGFGAWDDTFLGYGGINDRPAPADFDGDGKCDFAVLRDSDRKWFIDYASNGFVAGWDASYGGYGSFADYPCPADFDGDGRADIAVLRTSDRKWLIDYAAGGFGAWDENLGGYGGTGDRSMPGDYDGDGSDDIGVFHRSQNQICLDYHANGFGSWDACDQTHITWRQPATVAAPVRFALAPNRPNPFHDQTTIRFTLPGPSWVRLAVFDVHGRRVANLWDAEQTAGDHARTWNASGKLAAGIYFARLETAYGTVTRRLTLLR
jgi:hypothetical protein